MTLKVLKAGIAYSVVGRLMKTQEGQLFEESPWDISTTKIFQARGYVETVLEAAAPKVEVVEESAKEDLTLLSKTKLIELADERGLDSTGTKKKLLARLQGE
tara:strand:- start:1251 stop:1556 length:306 start_codon:yes stop_codon:yes gene_type:complete